MSAQPFPPKDNKVHFDRTINLGHVLTFIGFILAGFAAWSTLDKRLTVTEVTLQQYQAKTLAQEAQQREFVIELRDRIKEVNRGVERVNDKLDARTK